jgi:hypothetical protein
MGAGRGRRGSGVVGRRRLALIGPADTPLSRGQALLPGGEKANAAGAERAKISAG